MRIKALFQHHADVVLLFAFIFESLLIVWLRERIGIWITPILLLMTSLSIAILPILQPSFWREDHLDGIKASRSNLFLLFLAGVLITGKMMFSIIESYPIDASRSDIIPTLQNIYVDRFLNGDEVYAAGDCGGISCTPNYLPMQWIPFIIAEWLGLDYRWISIGVLWFALGMLFIVFRRTGLCGWQGLGRSSIPFLLLIFWMYKHPDGFGYTIEPLNAAYYLLFGISLFYSVPIIRAIGLAGVILSRYLIVFFIPLILWHSIRVNRRSAYFTGLLTIGIILALYVIPFLIPDPGAFWRGYQSYPIAAMGEWRGQSWQDAGAPPFQLFQGLGFASWIYTLVPSGLEFKFLISKYLHLFASAAGVVIAALVYNRYKKMVSHELLLLSGFKIYLTLFFSFLIVPYVYLHLIPSFFSLLIVMRYAQKRRQQKEISFS
jgi:hypothetical protein